MAGKKIMVLNLRWAERIGGPENMLRNLALYSNRNKVEMSFLFLGRGGPYEQELRSMGYSVDVIQARNGYDPVMRWKLALKLRALQPDVVIEHGVPPFVRPIVKAVTTASLLSFDHGEIEINRSKRKPWLNTLNGIERKLFSECIIVNSSANAELAITTHQLSRDRVQVVHLGLDLAEFQLTVTEDVSPPSGELIVGYVGRIQNYDKGSDLLPKLAQQLLVQGLSKFKIMVVGDGPDCDAVKGLVLDYGVADHFEFLGQRSDIPQLMALMDILVVPSRTEAFGLVAVEALAVGTRVVAFAVGGLTEILTGCSSARLVAPGNVDAMAEAVLDLWRSYGKTRAIEARQYVEARFDARRMAEAMLEIYQEFGCGSRR